MSESNLRVGLIGTGFGKSTQMPGFQSRHDIEVVAVCSGHLEKAQAFARECGIADAYDDYRAMLAKEQLDIVSIVTPPHLHKEMTLAAFRAGAHVLCEKPMALNATEAQEMCEAARAAGRIGMIDHEFRYLPWRAYVKHLIDDGYIGEPYHVSVVNFTGMRADPQRPFNWWSQRETGGGLLGAIGSHYIDAIHTFAGSIVEVCGLVDTRIAKRQEPSSGALRLVTSDDNCAFLARLAGGATASVHLSAVARPAGGEQIQIFGNHGSLSIDRENRVWGGKSNEPRLRELAIPPAFKVEGAGLIGPFNVLLARMIDGIRNGASEVSPSFADGLVVQRVLDAVRTSSEGAGWVKV